jgi:ATP-dependent Clp protease ATP-binding subunit ClpA
MFTPEFRNRLDAIVPFDYLPPSIVSRVIDKFVIQLELQLAERDVHIALEDDAKEWLIARGYDRLYGARPLARVIQETIKRPLADELLFGKLVNGGEVRVHVKDDSLAFQIIPAAPKPKRGKKKVAALPAPSEEDGD